MKVLCFSSFTFSYLNRARVLYTTLRRHQPNWHLTALITDAAPSSFTFDASKEPFDDIVWAHELAIPEFKSWLFQHNVVEACTAVKGPFLEQACSSSYDAVVYLDPDIAVFGSLQPVEELLERYEILLTPHITRPETDRIAVLDNELGSLKTGIYNLGFVAVRTSGEGARFASWWRDRLLDFCFEDIPSGLFVDQRWCDFVPAFFDSVGIVRDPGYNVASWNLSNRRISIEKSGALFVNGTSPLRFFHFTKLGVVGETMTRRYAKNNTDVYEIWNWYKRQVANSTAVGISPDYWAFNRYSDGSRISDEDRRVYRRNIELQGLYPNPFAEPATSPMRTWFASQRAETRG